MLRNVSLLLLLGGVAAWSTETGPPAALVRAEGAQVTVHLAGGRAVKGELQVRGSSLAVRTAGNAIEFDLTSVERVTRKSRATGALWGFVAGFAVAAPVGAYAGPYLADWGNPSASVRLRHAAGWGVFFGGIGAGIGALTGTERTVYRRSKTK